MKLKVMSFNTMHCENISSNKLDYESIINLIKKYNPDIIGLNEIYGTGFDLRIMSNQAAYIAKKLGYYSYFAPATRLHLLNYGNAIISKYPINDASIIKIPYPLVRTGNKLYEKRNILKVNIKGIDILVCHLGLNNDEQELGLETILDNITENSILMGDFNVNYDSSIILSIKSKMKCTGNQNSKLCYTYPSTNPKIRYDYIFVNNNIKVKSYKVLDEIISDHLPIIAEIEIK